MKIELNNLNRYKKQLEKILGNSFIKQIEKNNFKDLNFSEDILKSHKAHPFTKMWDSFKQDIEKSEESGALQISENSIRTLHLLDDLILIKNVQNKKRIIKDIKNKSKFYSSCFEASIVAGYCQLGYEVEILKERSEEGIRTCDFIIKHPNGEISVECKSLDDISNKEEIHWAELKYRLAKFLDKNRRSWRINIYANKQVKGNLKEFLFKEISKDIKNNELNTKIFSDNDFIVEYNKIADWGQFFQLPLKIEKKSENGFIEGEFNNNLNTYRNLRIVEIRPYKEQEISKRLISNFKSSVGQIPKKGPGIIHIGLPYRLGDYLLQIVDNSYDSLFEKLNKDSKRINAVVISSLVLENNPEIPSSLQSYIVPNISTSSELPSNFSILGTNNFTKNNILNADEGTVEFKFKIENKLQENAHLPLFYYSTDDGKFQFKVWFTWKNKFRMDIMTPSLGRVFLETDEFKPELKIEYSYAGTWKIKDEISIFINGNKLCTKNLQ